MCCGISRSKVSKIGLLMCLAFFVGAVICIILAGVNYQLLFTSFRSDGWQSLAAVQLAAIIYVFVLLVIGILAFWCEWNGLLIVVRIIFNILQFSTLLCLSVIFTGAIGIFALIGGSWGDLNEVVGCNSKYSGVLDSWKNIDAYLAEVDSALCSTDCPCNFKNPADFATDPDILVTYALWVKAINGDKYFQNCTSTVQNDAYTRYAEKVGYREDFVVENFAKYWELIEDKFECSGWCETTYLNSITSTEMTMYKYMFTGIDK
jgi:hypothetical protein